MSEPSNPETPASSIELKLFGRTDVGQIREHNEDNFLVADLTSKSRGLREEDRVRTVAKRGNLFAVCDGMGGAAAGEIASQMGVDLIYQAMAEGEDPRSGDELARNIVRAVEDAGLAIYNEARADRTRRGMGTTSTAAAMLDERLYLAQVGDSRAYILRGEQFVQVTRDQSLVNQLIEAGQLTEEEAETFEHNNIILQALGTSETVQVDLTYVDLRRGDILMMCSDGLTGMIRDAEIKDVLLAVPEPIDACRELTERANAAGGHDNITVLVVKFSGDGLPAPSPDDEPLAYRKYTLAGPDSLSATARNSRTTESGPISDEAKKETRRLRVGHTMMGPAPGATPSDPPPTEKDPNTLPSPGPVPQAAQVPTVTRSAPPAVRTGNVDSGLPPQFVGLIVLLSLILVAALGVFLLR